MLHNTINFCQVFLSLSLFYSFELKTNTQYDNIRSISHACAQTTMVTVSSILWVAFVSFYKKTTLITTVKVQRNVNEVRTRPMQWSCCFFFLLSHLIFRSDFLLDMHVYLEMRKKGNKPKSILCWLNECDRSRFRHRAHFKRQIGC